MKVIKKENGWLNLENNSFYEFGQITLDIYNYYNTIQKEIVSDAHTIQNSNLENKREILHAIWEQGETSIPEDFDMFHGVMENFIFDQEEQKKHAYRTFIPNTDSYFPIEKQKEWQEQGLEIAKKQGWKDVPKDAYFNLQDIYIMQATNNNCIPNVRVASCFIDYKWHYVFECEHDSNLLYFDMQEMRNSKKKYRYCHTCDKLFIANGKQKNCEQCRPNYKKNQDRKRKETLEGKHKKVQNYIRNCGKVDDNVLNDFMNESNYYRNIVQGKTQEINPEYKEPIKTSKDYAKWLETTHEYYKKLKVD